MQDEVKNTILKKKWQSQSMTMVKKKCQCVIKLIYKENLPMQKCKQISLFFR